MLFFVFFLNILCSVHFIYDAFSFADSCANVTCDDPPNTQCFLTPGLCDDSVGYAVCLYTVSLADTACDDGNAITMNDHCDGNGTCVGVGMSSHVVVLVFLHFVVWIISSFSSSFFCVLVVLSTLSRSSGHRGVFLCVSFVFLFCSSCRLRFIPQLIHVINMPAMTPLNVMMLACALSSTCSLSAIIQYL